MLATLRIRASAWGWNIPRIPGAETPAREPAFTFLCTKATRLIPARAWLNVSALAVYTLSSALVWNIRASPSQNPDKAGACCRIAYLSINSWPTQQLLLISFCTNIYSAYIFIFHFSPSTASLPDCCTRGSPRNVHTASEHVLLFAVPIQTWLHDCILGQIPDTHCSVFASIAKLALLQNSASWF